MKTIRAGVLEVAFSEVGDPHGEPVLLLHGFPYDINCFEDVAPRLADAGYRVIAPFMRGFGATRFLDGDAPRVGQQAAFCADLTAFVDALGIEKATLGGFDWGGRAACAVSALHPERVAGLVSGGSGYNIQDSDAARIPVDPASEQRFWYWYYLSSDRGADALADNRNDFCRHLWSSFSPTWRFDEAAYRRTTPSFDNPDFVAVVLHSYRQRIGAAGGDPRLADVEQELSRSPRIDVPTIILSGADDGVDPPVEETALAAHFSDLRRRTVLRGIGHNVPQEAPTAFIDAILELRA